MTGVTEVTPGEVESRLEDLQVVDVRDADAYAERHIPGAENVPMDELESVVEEYDWDDDVVVACYVGETSVQAARFIDHYADSNVATMAGGYEAWGGDVVTGERQR